MINKLEEIADTIRDITKLEFDRANGKFDAVIIIIETTGLKYRASVRTTLNDEKFVNVCVDAAENKSKLKID